MCKSNNAKSIAVLATSLALVAMAPPVLASEMEGPVLYSEVNNNISVYGAITAGNGMDGTAQNNVGVIAGKVRTHAKVNNNIKINGAVTAGNGMNGTAQNNVGVITDKSVGIGGGGGGGGGLLGKAVGFIKGLF